MAENSNFDFKALRKNLPAYKSAFQKGDRLGSLLGARCVALSEEEAVYEYDVSPDHYNPNGILHGGALFAVMDSSQGAFLHVVIDERFSYAVTGTATVRYEAALHQGMVQIKTTLERQDGRKYFVRSEATQEGKIVASLDETWIAVLPK